MSGKLLDILCFNMFIRGCWDAHASHLLLSFLSLPLFLYLSLSLNTFLSASQDGGSLVHPAADRSLFSHPGQRTLPGHGQPRKKAAGGWGGDGGRSAALRVLRLPPRPAGPRAGGDREEAGQNSQGAEQQEENPHQKPAARHLQPGMEEKWCKK